MSEDCQHKNPLTRDGTSQKQRLLKALSSDYVAIDEKTADQLWEMAGALASHIQYHDAEHIRQGDWATFFPDIAFDEVDFSQPHTALFHAFLGLFSHAQKHLNTLTDSHLNYYYQEVLQLLPKTATPDQAHILFKLAKNVSSYLVKAGTELKAHKDATGVELRYATNKDLVVNAAEINSLKSVFIDQKNQFRIYAAPVANSADGQGAELDGEPPQWFPFGESQHGKEDDDRTMIDGAVGFAIASPILRLQEGSRKVTFTLTLSEALTDLSEEDLTDTLHVAFTGAEGWLAPLTATDYQIQEQDLSFSVTLTSEIEAVVDFDAEVITEPFTTSWPIAKVTLNHEAANFALKPLQGLKIDALNITVDVSGVRDLVIQNDQSILDINKPFEPFGFAPTVWSNFYVGSTEVFQKDLSSLAIHIDWKDVPTDFTAHYNSYGLNLDNHSFLSRIRILHHKNWDTDITARARGQHLFYDPDDPLSFDTNEYHLLTNAINTLMEAIGYFDGHPMGLPIELDSVSIGLDGTEDGDNGQAAKLVRLKGELFAQYDRIQVYKEVASLYSAELDQLKIKLDIGLKDINEDFFSKVIYRAFEESPDDPGKIQGKDIKDMLSITNEVLQSLEELFSASFASIQQELTTSIGETSLGRNVTMAPLENWHQNLHRGFIKIELKAPNVAFGHKQYPQTYTKQAIALANHDPDSGNPEPQLPNEPYTPTIRSLSLAYTSSVDLDLSVANKDSYENRVEQFFHVEPFGVAERHRYHWLKESPLPLLPEWQQEGTLLIGLSKLNPAQSLSILFQVAEGTADPYAISPGLQWSYLSQNQWINFTTSQVLADTTSHLINSGIISFTIPKVATDQNTLLPAGKHWIRATIQTNSRAACQLIQVSTQAVAASFTDRRNDPNHLAEALPAESISKLVKSQASIKSVTQPFASFGGKTKEQDAAFHTRVSERLRHKQRAITIWDYEHLVLEHFPSVYKVKCLNHTHDRLEMVPGHVTLVIVSNLRNQNAVNPLQPTTSLSLLNDIDTYLQPYVSEFVELHVSNPDFEEISVRFNVKLRAGFDDPGYYENQLQEDLQRFLSPWAFEEGQDIAFEGRIHRSVILNFVEELEYVDYVTCFKIDQWVDDTLIPNVEEAQASTSKAILVSSTQHHITVLEDEDCACEEDEAAITNES